MARDRSGTSIHRQLFLSKTNSTVFQRMLSEECLKAEEGNPSKSDNNLNDFTTELLQKKKMKCLTGQGEVKTEKTQLRYCAEDS